MSQRLASVTLAPAAASANCIAASQSPGAAGNLTINGSAAAAGVATLDVARRVIVHSAADDTGRTWTVTGTDRYGRVQSESFAGANAGDAVSAKDYLTVTQIAVDAATAGAVTAGTNGKLSSQWIPVDRYSIQNLGVSVAKTGTANWSVELTQDDPFQGGGMVQPNTGLAAQYLTPYAAVAGLTSQTGAAQANLAPMAGVTAVRITLNSNTSGTVTMQLAPHFAEGG